MPVKQSAAILQQSVAEIVKPALRGDRWLELTYRARGRIAGIGEKR